MKKPDFLCNLTLVKFIRGLPEGMDLLASARKGGIFSKFVLRQIGILFQKVKRPNLSGKAELKIAIRKLLWSRGGARFIGKWGTYKRTPASKKIFKALCKDVVFEIITAATFRAFTPDDYADLKLASIEIRLLLLKTIAKASQELREINPDAVRNFKAIVANEPLSIIPAGAWRITWTEMLKVIGG
jgi:hypothetical protein